jgi:hypothetical protein
MATGGKHEMVRSSLLLGKRADGRTLGCGPYMLLGNQVALAAQLQAYVIFEIVPSSDENAAAEKLKSASLRNCLQLVVGRHARDVFVHIACDERDLNEGFSELSRVDGISRATIVSLKHE